MHLNSHQCCYHPLYITHTLTCVSQTGSILPAEVLKVCLKIRSVWSTKFSHNPNAHTLFITVYRLSEQKWKLVYFSVIYSRCLFYSVNYSSCLIFLQWGCQFWSLHFCTFCEKLTSVGHRLAVSLLIRIHITNKPSAITDQDTETTSHKPLNNTLPQSLF